MDEANRIPAALGGRASPGHAAARTARGAIEDALLGLPEIPLDFDREGLKDRLLRGVAYLYVVLDTPVVASAHLDGLREAAAVAAESRTILERAGNGGEAQARAAARLHTAEGMLREAEEAVAQIQLARREELVAGDLSAHVAPVRPFLASTDLPSLHAIARRPLLVHVNVEPVVPLPADPSPSAPTLPRPTTFAALRALSEEAASGDLARRLMQQPDAPPPSTPPPPPFAFEPAIEEIEVLRRLARDCLEDIANHRNLRKPNAIESWLDQAPFEQHIFDNLDAFAALGGSVLPQISLFAAEAKAPDPERAFAVALTLGSIEGSDTVGAAVMTLKQSAKETYPGWIEGLWLAPNLAVDTAMADLCTSSRPELVAIALDVMHARGSTRDEVVAMLLERTASEVATRVVRALATALPRHDAIDHLERICAVTQDDDLFLAAIEALLRRHHGPVLNLLRRTIDSFSASPRARRAVPLLCLVGRASDLDRLLAATNETPTVHALRGLGRFGHIESLGTLLNFLAHEDADIIAAAAEALDRITGAGLRETVEEPWDFELPPEAATADGIPIPLRKVERIVTDPEQWSAWVQDNARRLNAKSKTRGGIPFSPMQIVHEIEATSTPPDRREEAALELALVTGIRSLFSPNDWVTRQKKHIAELRTAVASMTHTPGAWAFGAASLGPSATSAPLFAAIPAATSAPTLPTETQQQESITPLRSLARPEPSPAEEADLHPSTVPVTVTLPPMLSEGPVLPFQPPLDQSTSAFTAAAITDSSSYGQGNAPLPDWILRVPADYTGEQTLPPMTEHAKNPLPFAPAPPETPLTAAPADYPVDATMPMPPLVAKHPLPFRSTSSSAAEPSGGDSQDKAPLPAWIPRVPADYTGEQTLPPMTEHAKNPLPFAPAPPETPLTAALADYAVDATMPMPPLVAKHPLPFRSTSSSAAEPSGVGSQDKAPLPAWISRVPADYTGEQTLPLTTERAKSPLLFSAPNPMRPKPPLTAARADYHVDATLPIPPLVAKDPLPFRTTASSLAEPSGGRSPPSPPAPEPPSPPSAPIDPRVSQSPMTDSSATSTPASGRVPHLTLEQYASLCAELAAFPRQIEAVFQRYGLGSLRDRLAVDLAWQERLRRRPTEFVEWQGLYQRYQVYWAEQARRGKAP